MNQDQIKQIVAQKALDFLNHNTKVGLGSGSTVFQFIKLLSEKVAQGLKIEVICASIEAENLARELNIPINNDLEVCDIYFDGADEIDQNKNCLKGKGKALLREKLIANMSKQVIILVDHSKKSHVLQNAPLVCELLPFGYKATIRHINQLGFHGHLRINANQEPVLTDNGNYLYDIKLQKPIDNPHLIQEGLKKIPGFIESGLFFNIVNKILIGLEDGQVIVYE